MKVMPQSRATRTALMASLMSIPRNSAPSDDAPKERMGSSSPVLPSFRFCMKIPFHHGDTESTESCLCRGSKSVVQLHSHSHDEQKVREALLVGGLDREHVVGGCDLLVELPLLDRLELEVELGLLEDRAVLRPDGRVVLEGVGTGPLVVHRV